MTHEHSPLPWRVNSGPTTIYIASADRGMTAFVGIVATPMQTGRDVQEDMANAALIVRAVNSHDALVKALEAIGRGTVAVLLDAELKEQPISRDVLKAILDQVRAALASAKGGE